jgi:transposase
MVLADKAYDATEIRRFVSSREGWANIPARRNRRDPICFSPYLYRHRNQVERFFNRINHCRRVVMRYEKRDANLLAFVKLAAIRLGCAFMSPRPIRVDWRRRAGSSPLHDSANEITPINASEWDGITLKAAWLMSGVENDTGGREHPAVSDN